MDMTPYRKDNSLADETDELQRENECLRIALERVEKDNADMANLVAKLQRTGLSKAFKYTLKAVLLAFVVAFAWFCASSMIYQRRIEDSALNALHIADTFILQARTLHEETVTKCNKIRTQQCNCANKMSRALEHLMEEQ